MARESRDEMQNRLNGAAEQIGGALGRLAGRIDNWEQQRDEIASELRKYIASAQEMLTSLGHGDNGGGSGKPQVQGVRRGHSRGKMSAQARQQQHEDWKAQRRTMKLH